MINILFTALQILWGFPQTLLGLFMYLYWRHRGAVSRMYHGAIVTEWTAGGGISLGLFVFVSGKARQGVVVHEYGHCIQSLMLGPLYLIAVGVPSYIWANLPALRKMRRETGRSYYSVYPENWANQLGEWGTGEKAA